MAQRGKGRARNVLEVLVRGRTGLSAVSQDAIAVPQGERVVYEIDEAWPPTGRRRGWLMRRLLLCADVVGLVVAYLVALEARASGADGRPRRAGLGGRALRRDAPALGPARADSTASTTATRSEPITRRSTTSSASSRSSRSGRGASSSSRIVAELAAPEPRSARRLLAPRGRSSSRCSAPSSRAIGRRQAGVRAERHHRRLGQRRAAARRQDREAPRVRPARRRVRRPRRPRAAPATERARVELLGTTDDLPRARSRARESIASSIAFSTDSHDQTLGVIRSMQDSDVQIDIVPRMFEVLGTNAQLHTIEGIPLVGLPSPRLSGSSRFLKRSLDLVAQRRSGSCCSRRSSLVVAAADQARLAGGRSSSGRCGWAPASGRSASSSSGRWSTTPRAGSPTSRT